MKTSQETLTVIDRLPELRLPLAARLKLWHRLYRILQAKVHNQKRIPRAQIDSVARASNEASKESRLEQGMHCLRSHRSLHYIHKTTLQDSVFSSGYLSICPLVSVLTPLVFLTQLSITDTSNHRCISSSGLLRCLSPNGL